MVLLSLLTKCQITHKHHQACLYLIFYTPLLSWTSYTIHSPHCPTSRVDRGRGIPLTRLTAVGAGDTAQ